MSSRGEVGWGGGGAGIRGLQAAEVMSLDQSKRRVKNKSLYSDPLCSPGRGGRVWRAAKARAAGKWQRMPSRPRRQH